MQAIPGLGERQRNSEWLVHDPVGIDEGLRTIDSLRDRRDMRAHELRGADGDFRDHAETIEVANY